MIMEYVVHALLRQLKFMDHDIRHLVDMEGMVLESLDGHFHSLGNI